ncbi:MAG: hypothetical protein JWL60_853 [Gemmatimonadetes bacterium]|jgi:hypothetical protein|nr:hypothetical protein [Gemmatimonadota bacterium]
MAILQQNQRSDDSARRPLDEALEQLWTALHHRRPESIPREQLRTLAGRVSREAHASALLPEQLVVAVKGSWARHPELREVHTRHEALGLLADIVGLCITEFFKAREREQPITTRRD